MLLNDVILNNKIRMNSAMKRDIVSVFAHLRPEDQNYLLDHLEDFVKPHEAIFMIPLFDDTIPRCLSKFVNYIQVNKPEKYMIDTYDVLVENPAASYPNCIFIGADVPVIYQTFQKEKCNPFNITNTLCGMPFQHTSDLYEAFKHLSYEMDKANISPFKYSKCILALSKAYDIIMRLATDMAGLEDMLVMETQAIAFDHMSGLIRDHMNEMYMQSLVSCEINILTSLVPPTTIVIDRLILRSLYMILQSNDEALRLKTVKFIQSRLASIEDPFRISTGCRFPRIKGISSIPTNRPRMKIDTALSDLIGYTTRKKIRDMIEDHTGVVENVQNITFDIPERLLAMYQLEFSKEYPIILTPIPNNLDIDHDGSDWRHILYYEDNMFIAFALKDSPEKMYGIHFFTNGAKDQTCNIVEFTGKKGVNYTFVY